MKREENDTAWEFEDTPQGQSVKGKGTFKRQSTQGASNETQDTEDRELGYSRRVVDYDREKQGKWRKVLVTCGIVVAIASIVVVAASKSNTYPDFMNNVKTAIGTAQSRVTSGVFDDPYTGKTIHFKYGKDTSSEVQIDHVVALHDAWMTGAQKLTQQEREALANDPENLLAVDGPENQRKGDGLCLNKSGCTGMYLPPNEKYHCEYAAKFTEVKSKYNLGLTKGQKETLVPLLEQCAAER